MKSSEYYNLVAKRKEISAMNNSAISVAGTQSIRTGL
jgi:hypothetical protein